jgi:protein TonB
MSAQLLEQMSYTPLRKHSDALLIWLFIAAVIHAIVLIGVTFISPKPQAISKAIEVTLVHSMAKKAPENAKYFAQSNQIAAGIADQKPLPNAKKKPKHGQHRKRQHETKAARSQTTVEHRLVTRKKAVKKMASAQKVLENPADADKSQQSQPEMSMEEIDKQIALLELQLQQQKEAAEKTRIKSINAISAHKYLATAYIKDWEKKVERVGNLNYPEINGKRDFSATLSMDVGINTDGSIYNIVIVKSSGIPELDKAAERIVRSMIFEPLPDILTQELDVLMIRREWVFSDESTLISSE